MSEPETNPVIQLPLHPSQAAVVTRDGWRIEFNAVGEAPQVSHNGQAFTLADGVMVPAHVANDRKVDGAPAVVLHRLNDTDIGQMIENKGVYFGIWRPVDREGCKLNVEFNVFAALEDTRFLTDRNPGKLATYNQDINRIAGLRDIFGHDGTMLVNDRAIYAAIRTRNYDALSQWHMPVKELVNGHNIDGEEIQSDNLYVHKDKGALKGTFTDKVSSDGCSLYWSASGHRNPSFVYVVPFTGGHGDWVHTDRNDLSSRPVRAELRPPA